MLIITVLCCIIEYVVYLGDWSIERDLYTDLFSNYNRKLRPIKGTNFFQKIRVHVEFAISQVESLVMCWFLFYLSALYVFCLVHL